MDTEEYMKDRVQDQIDWYDSKSGTNQRWFKRLRLTEIAVASVIPLLAGYIALDDTPLALVIGVMGVVVAVIAGTLGVYQFENNWVEYRAASEALKKEKFLYLTGAGPFDGTADENYKLLVQRVENLLSEENAGWAQNLKEASEADSTPS